MIKMMRITFSIVISLLAVGCVNKESTQTDATYIEPKNVCEVDDGILLMEDFNNSTAGNICEHLDALSSYVRSIPDTCQDYLLQHGGFAAKIGMSAVTRIDSSILRCATNHVVERYCSFSYLFQNSAEKSEYFSAQMATYVLNNPNEFIVQLNALNNGQAEWYVNKMEWQEGELKDKDSLAAIFEQSDVRPEYLVLLRQKLDNY